MKYTYTAKAGPADVRQGTIEAEDVKSAFERVCRLGFVPMDIHPQADPPASRRVPATPLPGRSRRLRARDRIVFLRQLHGMIDADVPLLYSLQLVASQTKNPAFREIVEQMAREVSDGASLSLALAKHPGIFPNYLVAMVRSGEMSGQLKTVLGRLSQFAQQQQEIAEKIQGSLIYPAIVLSMGTLTVFVLLTFVVPRLAAMFAEMGQNLPLATQVLIAVSGLLSKVWWILAAAGILFAGRLKSVYATAAGKEKIDSFLLTLPFWGKFLINRELERLTRTLGILLSSGVDMATALASAQEVVGNAAIRTQMRIASQEVAAGGSLAGALRARSYIASDLAGIVQVGEETGRLEVALQKLAENLEQDSGQMVKTATTLIEPVLILAIGLIIGFMVIALLLPIFDMNFISA